MAIKIEYAMSKGERRGERETRLREAVMAVLLQLNSSNYGMALKLLHDAIITFDNYVKDDFARQDKRKRKRPRRRKR